MKRNIDVDKLNLSFAGCGYLGLYHIGVASCFKVYAPHVLLNKIGGASVGALVATAMLCDVPLDIGTTGFLRTAIDARRRALGPFHPGFDILDLARKGMNAILPEDAHIRCSGRLFISVTRVKDSENVLLSQFESKEDLLQALVCSCFIPFYCGFIPPKFHGVGYTDGGFSDNQPILDDNTITVAPFCGESDICPQDTSCGWVQISLSRTSIAITPGNLYRFSRILFPGSPEALSKLCQQGFDDAFRFLHKNNLLKSAHCLSLQTSFFLSDSEALSEIEENEKAESEFSFRDSSKRTTMPESVQKAIQETCDKVNSGMINKLFKYRAVKLISYLTLPCTLPIDITMSLASKMSRYYPGFKRELASSLHDILTFLGQLRKKMGNPENQGYKLFCHMEVTQFDYTPGDKMNFNTATNGEKVPLPSSEPFNSGNKAGYPNHKQMSKTDLQINGNYNNIAKMKGQECVISNFKIDLTFDRPLAKSAPKDEFECDIETIKTFEKDYESKAIDAATTALDEKLGCIGDASTHKKSIHSADDLKKILTFAKKKEALMTFYYLDENKRLNFTKIFNVDTNPTNEQEADTEIMQDKTITIPCEGVSCTKGSE